MDSTLCTEGYVQDGKPSMAFTATVYCIECAFGGVVCAMYCVLTTAYQVLRVVYHTYVTFDWNHWTFVASSARPLLRGS